MNRQTGKARPIPEPGTEPVFWGVDCGSAEIKVVAVDSDGQILTRRRRRTLFPLIEHVHSALAGDDDEPSPLNSEQRKSRPDDSTGLAARPGHVVYATGYGRNHIQGMHGQLTEIKAHFLGVQHQLELDRDYTIIDIGGQDSKVIRAMPDRVDQFAINRKCAAGTGAYIEELAHRLEVPMDSLPELARKHDSDLTLNSYCTVFSGQEVIKLLMHGERVENLIQALYRSVVKRVLEMTAIDTDTLVFSGGVLQHHTLLVPLFAECFDQIETIMAPNAQFCGALGAAVHAMKETQDHGLPNHH